MAHRPDLANRFQRICKTLTNPMFPTWTSSTNPWPGTSPPSSPPTIANSTPTASETQTNANYEERKSEVVNQLQQLREKIEEGAETEVVHNLIALMRSLKGLEREESHFLSYSKAKHSQLQAEIIGLEEKVANGHDNKSLTDGLDHSLSKSAEEVNLARKELASKLRAILAVKHRLDDMPSQTELIQYERRFSELYVHIEGKHQQTQKYYDTYNTLLEIKELMLKEISLLNSISSQFQDAIASTAGRMKLVDSMEGIVKSSRQKLEKVQLGLQDEHKVCDALKEKYTAAIAEQTYVLSLESFSEPSGTDVLVLSSTSNSKLLN